MTQLRKQMLEEIQRRNYSHRTAKTYVRIVREFAAYFHQSPDKLGPEQIRQYQAHLFQTNSAALILSSAISPATLIASPSPTIAWSPSPTTKLPSAGEIMPMAIARE